MTAMSDDTDRGSRLSPEYDAFYYERYDACGTYERTDHWTAEFARLAGEIVTKLEPESVLDAGCAIGMLVEALVDLGVDAHGIDVSEYAVSQAPEDLRDRVKVGSLAEPLGRRYDLITSIEVIEHIEEPDLSKALGNLCEATDRILISSTPMHYDDPTHVSIRQPERWTREFAHRGFVRDVGFDAEFISPWAVLYVRNTRTWPEVIEDYDRQYWYDRREIHNTRQGIIALQADLSHLDEQHKAAVGQGSDEAGQTIQQLKLELSRLRDELHGVLAERGSARGDAIRLQHQLAVAERLAQEAVAQRDELQQHIDDIHASTTWRVGRGAMAPVRALRGRQ